MGGMTYCSPRNVFNSCVKSWRYFRTNKTFLERSFYWLSVDIVSFKIELGVKEKRCLMIRWHSSFSTLYDFSSASWDFGINLRLGDLGHLSILPIIGSHFALAMWAPPPPTFIRNFTMWTVDTGIFRICYCILQRLWVIWSVQTDQVTENILHARHLPDFADLLLYPGIPPVDEGFQCG